MKDGGRIAEGACGQMDVLWPLAVRAADAGEYERVSMLFAEARLRGMKPEEALRWHRLLIEAGDFEAARIAAGLSGDAAPIVLPDSSVQQSDDFLDFDPGAREPEAEEPVSPSLVRMFLRRFAGRADVYARQWYDARRDQSGYRPVREPLDERVAQLHLLGRITVGQYVLHPDETVSFAALDLDPTPAAWERLRLEPGVEEQGGLALPGLRDYAKALLATAANLSLALFPEETGGSGLHLWLFFEPRLDAATARAILRQILWRAGPQPPDVSVELFPKQERLTGKGFGNLIKLPLGVHQVTLRPSRFLDTELQPLPPEDGLAALRACSPEALTAAASAKVVPFPSATESRKSPSPDPLPLPDGPTPRALAEALASLEPGRPSEQAADRMLSGCAVLRELARRAHEERQLSADEARVLLYSVGLAGRENEHIEAMFASAGVSRKELDRVRRGLQGPVGCKRLHERFPELAKACTCPEPPPGGYATPALFAFRKPPSFERRAPAVQEIELAPVDSTADPLAEIDKRLARIEAAIERLLYPHSPDP